MKATIFILLGIPVLVLVYLGTIAIIREYFKK
jgi:hypothetical protein